LAFQAISINQGGERRGQHVLVARLVVGAVRAREGDAHTAEDRDFHGVILSSAVWPRRAAYAKLAATPQESTALRLRVRGPAFLGTVCAAVARQWETHMRQMHRILLCVAPLLVAFGARADVITDWNRIALPIVTSYSLAAPSYRDFAMLHVAMFECINTIEPRYEPYRTKLEAQPGASKDAAAAVAAARILVRLHPDAAPKVDAELKQYLEKLADRATGTAGIEAGSALGEKVAALVWEMRANDGASAADSYRPRTTPGRYVPTAPVTAPMWGGVTPFTMKNSAQFRPGPPLELKSAAWAANYNEVKQYGK